MARRQRREPTALQSVLTSIARTAAKLCDARDTRINLLDGDHFQLAAYAGTVPLVSNRDTHALDRRTPQGDAVLSRRVLHIRDMQRAVRDRYTAFADVARASGMRTVLVAPLTHGRTVLGTILIRRDRVQPFTPKQIALLKAFADQAAIAVENARLSDELAERNRALTEALEQQTATSEILRVISRSPTDVQPVFNAIIANAVRLCGGVYGVAWRYEKDLIHVGAVQNFSAEDEAELRGRFPRPLRDGGDIHRTLQSGRMISTPDIDAATDLPPSFIANLRRRNARSGVIVPIQRDDEVVGAIGVSHRDVEAFSASRIELLKTFAEQAVIAIENVRLFTELEERNRALAKALEQQTATAEILRTISRSYADVRPVFQTIVDSATRLLRGHSAVLSRIVDDRIDLAAYTHTDRAGDALLESFFPVPLHSSGSDIRPIRERVIGQRIPYSVADVETDPRVGERGRASARARGYRSQLVVPMLRDSEPIGTLAVTRREPGAFTDEEVALLQTFADQAVIAIENVRLFNELQARNGALTDSLEQQTATSEVLRVISRSPTDIQPVLDAVAESVARLCDAPDVSIFRIDGGVMQLAVHRGPIGSVPPYGEERVSLDRGTVVGRSVIEQRAIQVSDLSSEAEEYPEGSARARRFGNRAVLSVPLVREDVAIGAIAVRRTEVRPFTERQVALLQTFADQAVIAIENVRLFNELQARNAALAEALEQQTATSEILRVISSSPTDVQPVLDAVAEAAARLCAANDAIIRRVDGNTLRLWAHHGDIPVPHSDMPLAPGLGIGRAVLEKRTIHVHDATEVQPNDEHVELREFLQRVVRARTVLATPLIRDDVAIGVILIRRLEVRPFSEKQIQLLQTFADQAVIAIENVRLFKELEARNRELMETLARETATGDVLRAISRAQTDAQPVFEIIAESAQRLCGAGYGQVALYDGALLHMTAFHNVIPEGMEALRRRFPAAADRGSAMGRALRTRSVVQIPDVSNDPTYAYKNELQTMGFQSILVVPLLRNDEPIGAIAVGRRERGTFPDKQIELLKTFANQAVIAIENVRLFKELEARTEDLTRSVGELRALGEVGQAVSSTLDLETVLSTIASRASQLAGTDTCTVYEYDEAREEFHLRATHNVDERVLELTRVRPMRKGQGVGGRVAETRVPVQVEDVANEATYFGPLRDVLLEGGVRSVLAIPLLREDRLTGMLIVSRKIPGRFTDAVVALLQTFGTQSAIAIQNARLYRELEAKGRELEAASRHKSQFLANMSHELRTPMNAIIGYTELIADGIYGSVPEPVRDVLTRVDASGRHLLGLINDVLDLSKIEAGQLILTLAEYSMKEVVDAVVAAVEALATEKRLRLVVDMAPDLPTGRGDQRRLAQVLLNLVGNAIKFTEKGQVTIRVGVAAGLFTVAVTDTGPGIAIADQERIFEEFQQADTSTVRPKGGTGLGLAIARRIVALHGGRIWVESTPGDGATFRFTMPIRVEQQAVLRTAAS
jgi:GAF domain-containing protein